MRLACHCEGSQGLRSRGSYWQCKALRDFSRLGPDEPKFVNFFPHPWWRPEHLDQSRPEIEQDARQLRDYDELDPKLIEKLKAVKYEGKFRRGFRSFKTEHHMQETAKAHMRPVLSMSLNLHYSNKYISEHQRTVITELFEMFDQVNKTKARPRAYFEHAKLQYTVERYDGLVPIEQLNAGLTFLGFDVTLRPTLREFERPIYPYLQDAELMGKEGKVDVDEFTDWMVCRIFHCTVSDLAFIPKCPTNDHVDRGSNPTAMDNWLTSTGEQVGTPVQFNGKYAVIEKVRGQKPRCQLFRIQMHSNDPKKPGQKYWLSNNQLHKAVKACKRENCWALSTPLSTPSLSTQSAPSVSTQSTPSLSTPSLVQKSSMNPPMRQEVYEALARWVASARKAPEEKNATSVSAFASAVAKSEGVAILEGPEENKSIQTSSASFAEDVAWGSFNSSSSSGLLVEHNAFKKPSATASSPKSENRTKENSREAKSRERYEYAVGPTHAKCLTQECQHLFVDCSPSRYPSSAAAKATNSEFCAGPNQPKKPQNYGTTCSSWDHGDKGNAWCFVRKHSHCHETKADRSSREKSGNSYVNDINEPLIKSTVRCALTDPNQKLRRRKAEEGCEEFKVIAMSCVIPQLCLTLLMILVLFKFLSNGCSDKEGALQSEFVVEEDLEDLEDQIFDDFQIDDNNTETSAKALQETRKARPKKKGKQKQKTERPADMPDEFVVESDVDDEFDVQSDNPKEKRKQKRKKQNREEVDDGSDGCQMN